jgi:hypothetical protein
LTEHDPVQDRLELDRIGEQIVAGVERALPDWAESRVALILDAWGQLDAGERARAHERASDAGAAVAARVGGELRALFARSPTDQRGTPLEIVRGAVREPTELLRELGVPPVVRDAFDERAWPGDHYGLVPRTLGDLGDEELGPLHLAWGLAKTKALREPRS